MEIKQCSADNELLGTDKSERGAVMIVEAAIVFPMIFFILIFLIYLGNGYFQKAKIDSYVTQYAIAVAAKVADPLLENFSGSVPTAVSSSQLKIKPYRYLAPRSLNSAAQGKVGAIKKALISPGFFRGMEPSLKKCDFKVDSNVLYSTCALEVEYAVTLPIRFFWSPNEVEILQLTSRAEVPVTDVAEFIRNTDMVIDFLESNQTVQNAMNAVKGFFDKVSGSNS